MGFPFRNRITQEINKRVGFPFSMTILCQKTLSRIQPWKHALNVRFPKSSNHFDMSKKEIDHMHCEIRPKFISFDLHSTFKEKNSSFFFHTLQSMHIKPKQIKQSVARYQHEDYFLLWKKTKKITNQNKFRTGNGDVSC